jgi:hypothetical protein
MNVTKAMQIAAQLSLINMAEMYFPRVFENQALLDQCT